MAQVLPLPWLKSLAATCTSLGLLLHCDGEQYHDDHQMMVMMMVKMMVKIKSMLIMNMMVKIEMKMISNIRTNMMRDLRMRTRMIMMMVVAITKVLKIFECKG